MEWVDCAMHNSATGTQISKTLTWCINLISLLVLKVLSPQGSMHVNVTWCSSSHQSCSSSCSRSHQQSCNHCCDSYLVPFFILKWMNFVCFHDFTNSAKRHHDVTPVIGRLPSSHVSVSAAKQLVMTHLLMAGYHPQKIPWVWQSILMR